MSRHLQCRRAVMSALLLALPAPLVAQATNHRYPITADRRWTLGLGFQERVRVEGWSNFAFNPAGANDETFGLLRAFGHAELRRGDVFTALVQVKSALSTGRDLPGGDRAIDVDQIDVQQLYARATHPFGAWRASLTAGRFDMALGRERLVSPLDWVNARRTFQGAQAVVTGPRGSLRGFWTRPVQVRREKPNVWDSTRTLYGLSANHERPGFGVDAYWLGAATDGARFNGSGPARDERQMLGARLSTRGTPRRGAFDADIEAAWQLGTFDGSDIGARMAGAQAGWRPTAVTRVYLGFDYGSGDDSTSGKLGTFNQLYPLGHAHLGYADVHGRQNIVDLSWGASALARGATVMLDVHNFWRASTRDGLYGVDGTQSRPAGSGLSSRVGTEVDLTVRYALRPELPLQAGWSVYLPDRYLEQSGVSSTLMFAYLQMQYNW